MNKVFELYIANALRDEERYAVLDLPATPYEMLDALERAGCRSSEEAYYQVEEYLDFEYLESVISPDCSLNHLNALAEKLSELNDRQSITFEGLLRMEQEKNEGQISIHTLLQLAHNADCCHMLGEALKDSMRRMISWRSCPIFRRTCLTCWTLSGSDGKSDRRREVSLPGADMWYRIPNWSKSRSRMIHRQNLTIPSC